MCANNKKNIVKGKHLSDFDAVSLYPSAQKRAYYPSGECKVLSNE